MTSPTTSMPVSDISGSGTVSIDALLGGEGIDTAVYSENRSGCGLRTASSPWIWTARQVAELALNTELFLQLAGSRGNEAVVTQLYSSVLDVAPPPRGSCLFRGHARRRHEPGGSSGSCRGNRDQRPAYRSCGTGAGGHRIRLKAGEHKQFLCSPWWGAQQIQARNGQRPGNPGPVGR